jgi:hypothetical protein
MELRADDAFWAARRVAAFSNDMIRAIIHTGEFTDPAAEKALVDIMIKRRNTVVRTYLPAVNPIVDPRLTDHSLSFGNAAVDADVAHAPQAYRAAWFQFDNATGDARPLTETVSGTTHIDAPTNLPRVVGSYVEVDLVADSTEHPTWRQPVRTFFRRETGGWKLVGLERMPESMSANRKGGPGRS